MFLNKLHSWIRGDHQITELELANQQLYQKITTLQKELAEAKTEAEKNRMLFEQLNASVFTVSKSGEIILRDQSFHNAMAKENLIRDLKETVIEQARTILPQAVYLTTKKNSTTGMDVVTAVIRILVPK